MSDTHSAADPAAGMPFYMTPIGQTDSLMIIMIVGVIVVLVLGGVFYLSLHSVPDRMAHSVNHSQLQLIGILTLIALFTHNNAFWFAAIVIAALNPPDLMTPINIMARSLQRMAGLSSEEPDKPAHDAAPVAEDKPDAPSGKHPQEARNV